MNISTHQGNISLFISNCMKYSNGHWSSLQRAPGIRIFNEDICLNVYDQQSWKDSFFFFSFFSCFAPRLRQANFCAIFVRWVYFPFVLRLRLCRFLISQYYVDLSSYLLSHPGHAFISCPPHPMQLSWWKLKVFKAQHKTSEGKLALVLA